MPEYQKAFIGSYVNGHINLEDGFYVPFNPAEISVNEAIGISDVSQAGSMERVRWVQRGSFVGKQLPVRNSMPEQAQNLTTLSATLFFNTLNDLYQTSYEDVRNDIRKLYPYTNTTATADTAAASSGKLPKRPAVRKAKQICFFWGTIAVAGILKQMSVNYTMFAPDGKPVRAHVNITIEGFYVGEETASKLPGSGKTGSSAVLPDDPSNWKALYQGGPNPRKLL